MQKLDTYLEKDNIRYANDLGILFFTAFIPWFIIVNLYSLTEYQYLMNADITSFVLEIIPLILLLRELINNKYSIREILGYILFVLIGIICVKSSNGLTVYDGLLFAFSARNLKFRSIVCSFFVVASVLFVTVIGASYLGKIPDIIFVQNGTHIRHSLGYLYTSFPSQIFFYLCCAYVFLRNKNMKILEMVILEFVAISLFMKTGTRNPLIVTSALFFIVFIMKILEQKDIEWKVIKNSSAWLFPFLSIFSIVLSYLYNPGSRFFTLLNDLLSNRLMLSNNALHQFGFAWFGQKIIFNGVGAMGTYAKNYNVIDSSYVLNFVTRGPIFLLVITVLLCLFSFKLRKSNYDSSVYLLLILSLMAVHSTLDPQLLSLWYNPFFLVIGYVFRQDFNLNSNVYFLLR